MDELTKYGKFSFCAFIIEEKIVLLKTGTVKER